MKAARSRRGRSTKRGNASREHILEAAIEVLKERGYAGLSISAVCDKVDIAPTSIYWHFGSKAGLMEAVIERIGIHAHRIRESVTGAGSDPTARLEQLIASIRDLVLEQPFGSLTGVALLSEGRHATPELRATLKAARRKELEMAAGEIQAELGNDAPYAESLATMITACANYAALVYRSEEDEAEVDRILEALRTVLQLIIGGLPGRREN